MKSLLIVVAAFAMGCPEAKDPEPSPGDAASPAIHWVEREPGDSLQWDAWVSIRPIQDGRRLEIVYGPAWDTLGCKAVLGDGVAASVGSFVVQCEPLISEEKR